MHPDTRQNHVVQSVGGSVRSPCTRVTEGGLMQGKLGFPPCFPCAVAQQPLSMPAAGCSPNQGLATTQSQLTAISQAQTGT